MSDQVPDEVKKRAKELIEVVREIQNLEEKAESLKWEIDRDAEGGIEIEGGRIFYRSKTHFENLDQDLLKEQLRKRHGLSDEEIERLFSSATNEGLRQPTVVVYLDE